MSVTAKPCSKWDLERFIYSDPALNGVERFVALQVLKTLDNKFRPLERGLMSQALIGWRVRAWRETVNRAVRKLCVLGYFRKTWVSVPRPTKQGIKRVTRVWCELGPVLRRLVDYGRTDSAGQPRGVTGNHPSPTPPGRPGAVGSQVIAKSADRTGNASEISAQFKRETLEKWPRLAGTRAGPTPTPPPYAELAERQAAAIALGNRLEFGSEEELELADDEYSARVADARRRQADTLGHRNQPRRKTPRSRR